MALCLNLYTPIYYILGLYNSSLHNLILHYLIILNSIIAIQLNSNGVLDGCRFHTHHTTQRYSL